MIREGLTFDDLLLVPQYSDIESRSSIDISVQMGDLKFAHPIIPANMASIMGRDMVEAVIQSGGLAILHRFMPTEEQIEIAEDVVDYFGHKHFAVSIGIKPSDKEMVKRFYDVGVRIFCIDIAHGDSKHCVEMSSWIKSQYPGVFLIAGNVATGVGAERLWRAGADAVKVNVGAGSLCTTRIQTGNGVPQMTALMNVSAMRLALSMNGAAGRGPILNKPMYIIADGGCKNVGDVVKSLCFADMVMTGNLFAGVMETPGKVIHINGIAHKEYVGSSTHKTNHIEGVEAWVPCKEKFSDVLAKILEGLRSGMSYQNAHNLQELQDNPEFVRITNAGWIESNVHDVVIK